jgi:hypothetical protein
MGTFSEEEFLEDHSHEGYLKKRAGTDVSGLAFFLTGTFVEDHSYTH